MTTTGGNLPLNRTARRALAAAGVGAGAVVLAGVSGGPDSTALLSVLAALAPDLGFTLRACHVDHGIRPAAERSADLEAVRALCAALGVPLEVRSVPEGAIAREARESGRSLEEVARRHRHDLLQSAADDASAAGAAAPRFVALGHTRDDHLETVLMRVLQGAGPHGLAGIAARRGHVVRPLLEASRVDVNAHLSATGLAARTDPSNADIRFLRNRVRAVLVPALDRVAPGWRAGLADLARGMARVSRLLDVEAARLTWAPSDEGGWRIDRGEFFAADPAVRRHALLLLADRLLQGTHPLRLPRRFLTPVLGPDPGTARRVLIRGHGLSLRSDGPDLWWGPDIAGTAEKGYLVCVPREGILSIGAARGSLGTVPGSVIVAEFRRGTGARPGETAIPVREVAPPLVLRSRRKGDRIDGPRGSVTLKSLCAGWAVPSLRAADAPVLADRRGIVAVLGGVVGGETATRSPGPVPGEECLLVRIAGGAKERRA
jgi:tRNA(Ile)-lysidine synthetase-like protein